MTGVMNFNIDYVTDALKRKRLTGKLRQYSIRTLVLSLVMVEEKRNQQMMRSAWFRIKSTKQRKVQQFAFVQKLVKMRLQTSLYSIWNHSSSRRQSDVVRKQLLQYPAKVIGRVFNQKAKQLQEDSLRKIVRFSFSVKIKRQNVFVIEDIWKEYVRRNIFQTFFRGFSFKAIKAQEYITHLKGLEYIFETIRVRKLFDAFTVMSIKTITKNLGELQKIRHKKREQARIFNTNRNVQLNEMKRKVTNAVGQVNEANINNDRIKANGSRENGKKLMKLNQQIRVYEINIDHLEYEVDRLERQVSRKDHYIRNRGGNTTTLEHLQQLYEFIQNVQNFQGQKAQIYKRLTAGKDIQKTSSSLTHTIMQNINLQQLMCLYQKSVEPKKTQNYLNVQTENTSLKHLIGSLMQHQLMQSNGAAMLVAANELQEEVGLFLEERKQLK